MFILFLSKMDSIKNKKYKLVSFFIMLHFIVNNSPLQSAVTDPAFHKDGIIKQAQDSFYDPSVDYSLFVGRITDRDITNKIYKIKSENNNIKFFRAADALFFKENERQEFDCQAFVQGVEDFYIVVHIPHLEYCREDEGAFRIGTQVLGVSKILKERILYASQYRLILLKRKEDLIKQMTVTNEFLWTFKEEEIKLASFYDKKILLLEEQKKQALLDLQDKRSESIKLQKALADRLSFLDENLQFYRISGEEYFHDRWHLDHDLGPSMETKPPLAREVSKKELETHRWEKF